VSLSFSFFENEKREKWIKSTSAYHVSQPYVEGGIFPSHSGLGGFSGPSALFHSPAFSRGEWAQVPPWLYHHFIILIFLHAASPQNPFLFPHGFSPQPPFGEGRKHFLERGTKPKEGNEDGE
jgi:hypothetical protein